MEELCIKIIENLYIGDFKSSMSKSTHNMYNIKSILCVGNDMDNIFKTEYNYMKLEVEDSEDENILFNFEAVYNFIEEGLKNGGVLIHCRGGISRSPTIIIAYLMKSRKIGFEEAYKFLSELKPDIQPNNGFMEQLRLFDKQVNKVVENVYKCSVCRKNIFDDSNIDFTHEFSPKEHYSYKRFKKVRITYYSIVIC
jgi:dual specificity phosphatase 12